MPIPITLQELLKKQGEMLTPFLMLIAQKQLEIDCTGVDRLPAETLDHLFSHAPDSWDTGDFWNIINIDTVSDGLAADLMTWIDRRQGRSPAKTEAIAPTEIIAEKPEEKQPLSTEIIAENGARSPLDIFKLRDEAIADYRDYIESFLKLRDPKIKAFVDRELKRGLLWPDPLVQLNPAYTKGGGVTRLIDEGLLHPKCRDYFPNYIRKYNFHLHQEQAFRAARNNRPYVVTTGTGSGKSMTYVVPIFDDLLRHPEIEGVRAILVYPMNALINSQKEEFDKYLKEVPNTPIRVERYTGQESLADKIKVQQHPPHILLTNYMMLELMLSRVHEEKLVASPVLKFLVLDELHTYRGRQGADVAILIRKLRQRCGQNLLCIGTSATMSTKGTRTDRNQTVAAVASKLFGVEVTPENVIDETLERSIRRPDPTAAELAAALETGLPPESERTLEAFQTHPLAAWVEVNFGLESEGGHLVRRTPISLAAGAAKLAAETGADGELCADILRQVLLWGSKTRGLAFRLHQFISQGGSVYATAETGEKRELTLEGKYATDSDRLLYPLAFCRECGQDYYLVEYDRDRNQVKPLIPTALNTGDDADIQSGYLTLAEPGLWEESDRDRLPDTWFRETKKKGRFPKKEYAEFIPQKLQVLPNGRVTDSLTKGTAFWFVPKPFLTCLNCGVVHDKRKSEFTKLSRLSTEGRSTATTLLCLSAVNRLKTSGAVSPQAQKILSFTDNRQDASLQAGHFNDFVQTSLLRTSLNGAIKANQTLTQQQLAQAVVEQMNLPQSDYATEVAEYGSGKRRNEKAFHKLIEYRLYEDLRRGWRIVQPNLEQCGLLAIDYDGLEDICAHVDLWQKHSDPILLQASPQQRYHAIAAVLDQLRKDRVLDAELLQPQRVEQLKKEVRQAIKDPWCFDESEDLVPAPWASTSTAKTKQYTVKLTPRSKIGKFLRSAQTWPLWGRNLSEIEYQNLIKNLIAALADSGYLVREGDKVQLRVDAFVWRSQNVDFIRPDPMASKRLQGDEDVSVEVNRFFRNFYDRDGAEIQNMEGREHTGQVAIGDRQDRENKFRSGKLSALFCSPTMELGIDIADLNIVHMRNVPPSPANYAQRSGRAGRSGLEALVITYASAGSGHDQYFFKRPQQMVAGVVVPPKLELGNRDLIESHIHSLWLAETGVQFEKSMNQILDLDAGDYPLKESVRNHLRLTSEQKEKCFQAAKEIFKDKFCRRDLENATWCTDNFLWEAIDNALIRFDQACDRWRNLYRDAVTQLTISREASDRHRKGLTSDLEQQKADALEREAKRQIALLVAQVDGNKNASQLEFYPYRYFASEGFLPGYNFPRLPVRAYIPAGNKSEFISRPKVVAIREFAPGNILYYEGNKFQIHKTRIPVKGIESAYQRMAMCPRCGYFHTGEDWKLDLCENCGAKLTADSRGNWAKHNRILPMETMLTRPKERITCDEEERLKSGYNITTHFRFQERRQEVADVVAEDGRKLLELTYGDTAQIRRINRGLRWGEERGFKLNVATGYWESKDKKKPEISDLENLHTEVYLMVEDVCNVLLIKPCDIPKEEAEEFLASFQYAIERAIQAVYKLEDNELASERLGKGEYLLFWEASEGGAGVLSQILENPKAFQQLAAEAMDICHFIEEKKSCTKACYECLLSYRNQFDQPLLDRHIIKSHLERLQTSKIERHIDDISRQQQYQKLRDRTDPNSPFEREFLDELYNQGLPLPDAAQPFIPEANIKPDFIYWDQKIAIFCDGSAHDDPEKRERDRVKRDDLKYNLHYQVLSVRHDEDWRSLLAPIFLSGWFNAPT